MGHIVITGTGRAGTSFLVRYLTELGFDTHISRRGAGNWDEDANAGLEDLPVGAACEDLPQVIKSPWIFDHIDEILSNPKLEIELAIIPVRNIVEAATSRTIVELRTIGRQVAGSGVEVGTTWGRTPGGTVFSLHPMDQARILAVGFHLLVQRFTEAEIPLLFLAFPRLVQDWDYLFRKLKPHLPPGISADDARGAHERTADVRKVRVGKEIAAAASAGAASTAAIKVTQPGLAYPPYSELGRIALQREIERLGHEQQKLIETASQQAQTIAELQALNEAYQRDIERLHQEQQVLTEAASQQTQTIAELQAATESYQREAAEEKRSEQLLAAELDRLQRALEQQRAESKAAKSTIEQLYQSRSWRMTRIFRDIRTGWRKS